MGAAYDLIVVGGGPAGAACAIGAARLGARVLVLERDQGSSRKVGEVFEAAIRAPLVELGLWDGFLRLGHERVPESLSCWGGADPVARPSVRHGFGEGFLVDRPSVEMWLREQAREAGVTIIGSRPRESQATAGLATVRWAEGAASAPLVVDATGRGSAALGRGRERLDRLIGIVATPQWPVGMRPDPRLLVEACREGWWYSAALPGHRAVFAFMTDADLCPRDASARQAWLMAQLAAAPHTAERFARLSSQPRWRVAPAHSSRQVPSPEPWRVPVGDAAAAYDPLSGQGVGLALSKGVALARLLRGGPARAVADYRAAEASAWADYVAIRGRIYGAEARWVEAPFWARRRLSP